MASASALDSLTCAVSGASSGRGEDGRSRTRRSHEKRWNRWTASPAGSEAKRLELAPPCKLSSLAERLNDGRLPDREVVANLESETRKLCEVGGRRFRVALLPTQTPACGNPARHSSATGPDSGQNATGVDERRNCDEQIVFR